MLGQAMVVLVGSHTGMEPRCVMNQRYCDYRCFKASSNPAQAAPNCRVPRRVTLAACFAQSRIPHEAKVVCVHRSTAGGGERQRAWGPLLGCDTTPPGNNAVNVRM